MKVAHTADSALALKKPNEFRNLYWPLLALAVVLLIGAGSIIWNYEHPFGFNWDESVYFNEMQMDVTQFHAHGFRGLIKTWLVGDSLRPPAYRVFAFPFAVLLGPSPFVLRFVAFLFRLFTLTLLYLAVRRVSSEAAAAVSVILLALCPDFIFFGTVFYNEYALYLAIAGMCYFILRSWNQPIGSIVDCLGLGVFLGIGALAKASFLLLAACFLGMVVLIGLGKRVSGPRPQFILNACVVGALIAAPWWLLNFRSALGYLRYAANFSRDSMGSSGLGLAVHFLLRFLQEGLGLPIGCLCIVFVVAALIHCFQRRHTWNRGSTSWAMICLLLAPVPIVLAPLATHNQVMYHTSPALVLLAPGFALLANIEGWLSSRIRMVVITMVIVLQLVLTLTPVALRKEYPGQRFVWTTLGRWDQWDWNDFRLMLRSHGLKQPSIGFVGLLNALNPAEIQYAWLSHHEPPPPVALLWRLENGSANLPAIIAAAETNDVVFTVPELALSSGGTENSRDNQYNREFAAEMANNVDFGAPVNLSIGRLHPVNICIFIRKDLFEKQALHSVDHQGH